MRNHALELPNVVLKVFKDLVQNHLIMNTKRINILLIVVMLCTATGVKAQSTTVRFGYDACGNRTERYMEIKKIEENGKSIDSQDDQGWLSSADDVIAGVQIAIFPNPTDGKLTLSRSGNGDAVIHATICTATGAVIEKCDVSSLRHDFDLSRLPSGIYILRLDSATESQTWKVIKR